MSKLRRIDLSDDSPLLLGLAYLLLVAGVLFSAFSYPINSPLAADTEYYFFVGNHLLDGLGLTDVDGTFFSAHGPLGPLVWALLHDLGGGSSVGPRIFGFIALGAALLLTVRIAHQLGGSRSALLCAAGLLFVPFFWETVGQLYLDQVQFLLSIWAALLLLRFRSANFIAAGFVLGVAILFKETSALIALAPLGWIGFAARGRFVKLYGYFLLSLLTTVVWWWIVVWIEAGVVFPFDRLESAVGVVYLGTSWLIVAAFVAAGAIFFLLKRRQPESRVLLIAWAALLPPIAITLANHLAGRQLIIWAALSVVFAAVLLADLRGRYIALILALAVVGTILNGKQFEPKPLTSPEYLRLSEYLGTQHSGENITAMWRANRRIASNAGNIYFTELLSVSNCPCDGRDLAESEVPAQLANTENSLLVLIRAERLARYLEERFPRSYSIIWHNRREKVDVLRVTIDEVPTEQQLKTTLNEFRQNLRNIKDGYNSAVTIKPFPFGDDGWQKP